MKGGVVLEACRRLYSAWRQAGKNFKAAAVVMYVFFVADVVASVMLMGQVGMLLRLDVLTAFAEAAVFYIFLVPIMMLIAHRDIQRGRADVADFALLFLFMHVTFTIFFKLGLTFWI